MKSFSLGDDIAEIQLIKKYIFQSMQIYRLQNKSGKGKQK
jgi:hypothetical protein